MTTTSIKVAWKLADDISTDPARLDVRAIHAFLTTAYWSQGIPLDTVRRAVAHSLCVGAYAGDEQVGFARLVTDRATFAYLADVYVLEAHRGAGPVGAHAAGAAAAPRRAGPAAPAAGDARRAGPVRPLRLHAPGRAGALHGASRSAGVRRARGGPGLNPSEEPR